MDFDLLFSSPFYLTKSKIRACVAQWGKKLSGRVLDNGCGSQGYRKLLPAEISYLGLERNLTQHPQVGGSALELPFSDGVFDHILCMEVLEHLSEPELALREMARVTRPGGRLILSTPQTWYLHYEPYDFYRYTRYGLQYLLQKAGYRPLEFERTGGFWTVVLSRCVEVMFHFTFALTIPIRWVTGSDNGRWRLAVMVNIPLTLAALAWQKLFESRQSPYVQGWIVLAEKVMEKKL